MFCLQAIINIIQNQELQKYKNKAKYLQKLFRTDNISVIIKIIQKLVNRSKKYSNFHKTMKFKLKDKNESIHKLKDDLLSIVDDSTLLQNQFEIRVKEINELTQNFNKLKEENEELQKQIFDEQSNTSKLLNEKSQQIQILQIELKRHKTESYDKIIKLTQTSEFLKNDFRSIINQLQNKVSHLQRRVKLYETQNQVSPTDLQHVNNQLKDTKAMFKRLSNVLSNSD